MKAGELAATGTSTVKAIDPALSVLVPLLAAMACDATPDTPRSLTTLPEPTDTVRATVLYDTGDYPFGNVVAAEPLDDGRLAVVDHLNHHVVIFDERGEPVDTIGREGLGPGELRGPSVATQFDDGSLAVLSHQTSRVTVFRPGREPVTTPVWLRGTSTSLNGRIAEGPVVYAWHFERRAETPAEAGRFVEAGPSNRVDVHDRYVIVPDHPGEMYRWTVEGGDEAAAHPYYPAKRHSINRHGDFAFLDADSTIVIGNLETGVEQRIALPDWDPVTQKADVIEQGFAFLGYRGRPRAMADLPPIRITSVYIDDSKRLWLGRTAWIEALVGHEYTAVVVDLDTHWVTATVLPASTHISREGLYVRRDRAAAITRDQLGREVVHVLDLTGLPRSAQFLNDR